MGKYFTVAELTRSTVAAAAGLDNVPGAADAERLELLVGRVLDPVRERWGAPITVTSGYRSPRLNAMAGGAPRSQHMRGEAADITAGSAAANRRLFDMIAGMCRAGEIAFDQLIDERGYRWLHISYSSNNRGQVLHL